jgi:hypothetical protein
MVTKLDVDKAFLISEIIDKVLNCYDSFGNLEDNYYNNLILPELTIEAFERLKEIKNGNFK